MRGALAVRPSVALLAADLFPSSRRGFLLLHRRNPCVAPRPPRYRLSTVSAMASAFKPEESRVPPALQLPTPPVSKVRSFFNVFSSPFGSGSARFWSFWAILVVQDRSLPVVGDSGQGEEHRPCSQSDWGGRPEGGAACSFAGRFRQIRSYVLGMLSDHTSVCYFDYPHIIQFE